MTDAEKNSEKKESFEEKMERLKQIVSKLENPDTPLDDSLTLYEKGVGLVRECSALLDSAAEKVKLLSRGENGEVITVDLPPQNS